MDTPQDIAGSFFAAAEKAVALKSGTAEQAARELRERLRNKLGPIVGRYEQELEPIVLAIASLPERQGGKFTCKNADFRGSSVSMNVSLTYARGSDAQTFKIDAFTTTDGKDSFSLLYESKSEKSSGSRPEDAQSFADIREKLAVWFAEVAPDRLGDLKAALMPEPSVALENSMRIERPLRLMKGAAGAPA